MKERLGDFEVLRELGRGGMGVVYEARQVSLNRKVALKVLSGGLGLTGKAVTRFKREAEAAAKLHHTNIVPIYATGEEDGTHFYAMELIEGPSLDKVIKQMRAHAMSRVQCRESTRQQTTEQTPKPSCNEHDLAETILDASHSTADSRPSTDSDMSDSSMSLGSGSTYFDSVARIIAEVADGLDYAHKQGVIHRDIKPSNLLLSPEGRLHINDFGLARMLEEPGMTISGEFLGSPSYMSPEQIAAGRLPLDHRTDIYSLGVVLYELLALQAPFKGQSRDQVLAQIVQKEPKPPRRLNKKVPVDLETICLKTMEKDPDRRYQTAGAMAEDLRRFVNRFAISARRAGPLARTIKWARRRPALASVSGLALVAVVVASMFGYRATVAGERLLTQQRQNAVDRATLIAMSGDLHAAEKAISEAELLSASSGQIRMLRGQVAYHRGDFNQAVQHLEQAVQLLPESVSARGLLAASYNWTGEWDEHQRIIVELESMTPASPEDALFKGKAQSFMSPERGLNTVDEAVRQRNSSPLARLVRAGVRADRAMDTSDPQLAELAIEDVSLARAMMPDAVAVLHESVASHLIAAGLFETTGQPAKAKAFLTQAGRDAEALAKFPDSAMAVWARINYMRYVGLQDEYYREAKRAAEQIGNSYVRYYYGLALYERGELQEAIEALASNRTGAFDVLLGAYILNELPEGRARVMKTYNELESHRPTGDFAIYNKTVLLLAGLKSEAIAGWREAQKEKSRLPVLNREFFDPLLGFLCGDVSEEELLKAAGASRRNQVMAHFNIGLKHLADGDRAAAHDHFEKSVATRCFYFSDHDISRAFLKRMERDPNWPPWIPMKN